MIQRLLLAVIILDIPFPLDSRIGYDPDLARLHVYTGYNVAATTFSLVALYAMWLPKIALKLCSVPRLFLQMSTPLAVYLMCVVLSAIWAYHTSLSLFEIFKVVQVFLLFVYVVGAVRTRREIQFLITMLIVSLLLQSMFMIALWTWGESVRIPGISSSMHFSGTDNVSRLGGTMGSPNVAASYLCLLLTPALSMLFTPVGRAYKWLAATAFGSGTIALVFTLSRGAWISFAFAIPVFFFFAWRRGAVSSRHVLLVGVVIVLVCTTVSGALYGRLFEEEGTSAEGRIPLMQMAQLVITDHPILGIGANNFALVVWRYVGPEFIGGYVSAVHNKYLLVWAETGIVSLVAFLWFLTSTVRRGLLCWQREDAELAFPTMAFAVAIAGQMLQMGVSRFTDRSSIQLLWLVAAIISAIVCLSGERRTGEVPSHARL